MNNTKTNLNDMKIKVLEEIPFIDIKPFSHNIISLELRIIAEEYGQDVANKIIQDFKLDERGWHTEPVPELQS